MAFEDQCKIIEKHLRGTDMGCAYEGALSIVQLAIADGYLLFKPNLNNNIIEINPGIIISKLSIKDDDVITITIDTDKWDLMRATEMLHAYKEIFPNNKVVGELKGMEISVSAPDLAQK